MAAAMIPLAIVLLVAPAVAISGAGDVGFRATLIRTAESRNMSLAVERSQRRLSRYTSNMATQAPITMNERWGDYIMQFSIGEPPVTVWAEADTGSDLVWVKCSPCTGCNPPPSPLYDPTQSSSFSSLSCMSSPCEALPSSTIISNPCTNSSSCLYKYAYGSGDHYTQGNLGTENFTFVDGYVAEAVSFGCSDTIFGSQFGGTSGLVGLGRGKLSLVSQLGAGRFAYCLPSDATTENTILFGSLAVLDPSMSSTPLIDNSVNTYYYVNLQGITYGDSILPIAENTFAIDSSSGQGGIIFDSGTMYTYLVDTAYNMVKQAVSSEISRQRYEVVDGASYNSNLDLCFKTVDFDMLVVPTLVLRFSGADMTLNKTNYLKVVPTDNTDSMQVVCMTILSSTASKLSISIIGNIMQANFHLVYDLNSMTLSFQAADCGAFGN